MPTLDEKKKQELFLAQQRIKTAGVKTRIVSEDERELLQEMQMENAKDSRFFEQQHLDRIINENKAYL